MLLLLLEQRRRLHNAAIATGEDEELTEAEGHVEDDPVRVLALITGICQVGQARLKIAVALDIDASFPNLPQHGLVDHHRLTHLVQADQHLPAAVLEPVCTALEREALETGQ